MPGCRYKRTGEPYDTDVIELHREVSPTNALVAPSRDEAGEDTVYSKERPNDNIQYVL